MTASARNDDSDPPSRWAGKDPDGTTLNAATRTLDVLNGGDRTVAVIDAASRSRTATVRLAPPIPNVEDVPAGMAVDPISHSVDISRRSCDHAAVVIDDPSRGMRRLPVGHSTVDVAADPAANIPYTAANPDTSTGSAIGVTTEIATASGDVGGEPTQLGLNPITRTPSVGCNNAEFGAVTRPQR